MKIKIVTNLFWKYIAFIIAKVKECCNAVVIDIVTYFPSSRVEKMTLKPYTEAWDDVLVVPGFFIGYKPFLCAEDVAHGLDSFLLSRGDDMGVGSQGELNFEPQSQTQGIGRTAPSCRYLYLFNSFCWLPPDECMVRYYMI